MSIKASSHLPMAMDEQHSHEVGGCINKTELETYFATESVVVLEAVDGMEVDDRGEDVAFLPYLYADKTVRYPARSGSSSSASRLAKSSGCRLNTTVPSLRGHWLGCRSQANSIPLKSGSCR
jgi:hypothetical protein